MNQHNFTKEGGTLIFRLASTLFLHLFACAHAWAGDESLTSALTEKFKNALTTRIPGAEIRIPSLEKICSEPPLRDYSTISKVRLVEDRPQGVALFELNGIGADGTERSDLVQTPYSAWKKVLSPVRRIYPNSKLKDEDFKVQEVNVASGPAREYRGVMVAPDTVMSGFQSRQSILENQFVTTSSIEKQPELRKGDMVRLDLTSGDLTLSTQAVASESGSVGDRIRVLTNKSKKEVVGTIRDDHSVEVRL
ncbi:MAG: flagellar basal body P-ring formation protein FlgA [Bdellovibrionales bacterium]|nr:flagellar basal body P-ring formation protein FlgA [Bdellovibrionales bacterium]